MKFPKLVIKEAKVLKRRATKQELSILDINRLVPTSASHCIYGQMTGNCFSDRAIELIEKCASRVYRGDIVGVSQVERRHLNGTPKKKSRYEYWSPIEVFIAKNDYKMNNRLIQFLKGEIKSLPS